MGHKHSKVDLNNSNSNDHNLSSQTGANEGSVSYVSNEAEVLNTLSKTLARVKLDPSATSLIIENIKAKMKHARVAILADDSDTMNDHLFTNPTAHPNFPLSSDHHPPPTRFQELRIMVKMILDNLKLFTSEPLDLFFLNRHGETNVKNFEEISNCFMHSPKGHRPLITEINKLIAYEQYKLNPGQELLVFIPTAGFATDHEGDADLLKKNLLGHLNSMERLHFTFMLCTDDPTVFNHLNQIAQSHDRIGLVGDFELEKYLVKAFHLNDPLDPFTGFNLSLPDYLIKSFITAVDSNVKKVYLEMAQPFVPKNRFIPPQQQAVPVNNNNNDNKSNNGDSGSLVGNPTSNVALSMFRDFAKKFNIRNDFSKKLRSLGDFKVVIICDDSGSMLNDAFSEEFRKPKQRISSRFEELEKMVKHVIDFTAVLSKQPLDVLFFNRPGVSNVTSFNQVSHLFARPPAGGTPTVSVLAEAVLTNEPIMSEKKLLIFIATDGCPMDPKGKSDVPALNRLLQEFMEKYPNLYITFMACVSDESLLETMDHWGETFQRVGVVDEFNVEEKEMKDKHKDDPAFTFTIGDYITKALLVSVDPEIKQIFKDTESDDEAEGK